MRSLLLLACLVALPIEARAAAPRAQKPRLPANTLRVPMVRQVTEYSCGRATLTSLLYYWGVFEGRERELNAHTKTDPVYGTEGRDIVHTARRWGLQAKWKERQTLSDLRQALQRGEPPMVVLQAWPEGREAKRAWSDPEMNAGHYAVVVGMDRRNVYFMDPSSVRDYAFIPRAEFEQRWHGGINFKNGGSRNSSHYAIYVSGPRRPRMVLEPMK